MCKNKLIASQKGRKAKKKATTATTRTSTGAKMHTRIVRVAAEHIQNGMQLKTAGKKTKTINENERRESQANF